MDAAATPLPGSFVTHLFSHLADGELREEVPKAVAAKVFDELARPKLLPKADESGLSGIFGVSDDHRPSRETLAS
jgi:hypothetical protein